jgi:hypothetical protein
MSGFYSKPQVLMDYLNRIGAEELSFKRFMVKEYHGNYYEEKAVIRIEEGRIKCNNKEYDPTDAERVAIETSLINANFPKSIGARDVDAIQQHLGGTTYYEIWDRKDDLIVMVQQSIRSERGAKHYP